MNKIKRIFTVFKQIYTVLTLKQRTMSIVAFLWSFVASIFELLGVTLILPFIMAIMNPKELMENKYVALFLNQVNITEEKTFILILGLLIVFIYLVKNIVLLYSRYQQSKYCSDISQQLSVTMLKSYISKDFEFFLNTNSSEIMRGVEGDVNDFVQTIKVLFAFIAEMITVSMIVAFVLLTDFYTAVSVSLISAILILILVLFSKSIMTRVGVNVRKSSTKKSKIAYQLTSGIKDIYVTQRKELFINQYDTASRELKKNVLLSEMMNQVPERVIEFTIVGGIILIVTIRIISGYDAEKYIPQLAMLAVACFRLLPSLNKITNTFNQVLFYHPGTQNVCNNIEEARRIIANNKAPLEDKKTLEFENELEIKCVDWKYAKAEKEVIEGLDLKINKGESIALIGKSGAGKTTLADMILGLLPPKKGTIEMDGTNIYTIPKTWAKQIGYVPQSVFLLDDTVRNNIAFGQDEDIIEDSKVWEALKDAQLDGFIKTLPDGLDTIVGERGVKFSGGQRQRIAIARVMYDNPEILVLDEATSALDDETEKAVMEAVESLQGRKTMIIIAHRLSTIKKCDKIYEIVDGKAELRKHEDIFGEIV